MVVGERTNEKDRQRAEFGRKLNLVLDQKSDCPRGRGRAAWLYRALRNTSGQRLVSASQVRKYLRGKDMPDQAHLSIMCARLGVSLDRLWPGNVDFTRFDARLDELLRLWRDLDAVAREHLLSTARYASGSPKSPRKPREPSEPPDDEDPTPSGPPPAARPTA